MTVTTGRTAPLPAVECPPLPAPLGRLLLAGALSLTMGLAATAGLAHSQAPDLAGSLQVKSRIVTAGRAARIAAIQVPSGQPILAGTVLASVEDLELAARRAEQERLVATLEAELVQVQARADMELTGRRESLEAEIFETKLKLAQYLKQQFTYKVGTVAWQKHLENPEETLPPDLLPAGPLQPLAFSEAEPTTPAAPGVLQHERLLNALEVATAQVELCSQRQAELERRLENLPEHVAEAMGVLVAETRLAQARTALEELNTENDALTIAAEIDGTVGIYRKQVGDQVTAEEPLVVLLDEEQPFVLLQIPSRDLPAFPAGTRLHLEFPGGTRGQGMVAVAPPQVIEATEANGRIQPGEAVVSLQIIPAGKVWPHLPVGTEILVHRP